MKLKLYMQYVMIAAAAALATARASADDSTLNLSPSAEVRGEKILLRELVADRENLPRDWQHREVMASPEPGKTQTYSITTIASALQRYPDMKGVVLRGNLNTVIRRMDTTLDPEIITQAVRRHIDTLDPWINEKIQVTFEPFNTVRQLPEGKTSIAVRAYEEIPGSANMVRFNVDIMVDEIQARTLEVKAKILPFRAVWVAKRSMDQKTVISRDDLEPREIPLDAGQNAYVSSAEEIAGMELSRRIKQGQPIMRHVLQPPLCASRGDPVTVISGNKGLEIRLSARALASGRQGDQILCENEQSKRRVLVKLTGIREGSLYITDFQRKATP